jgi:hypothetical protein
MRKSGYRRDVAIHRPAKNTAETVDTTVAMKMYSADGLYSGGSSCCGAESERYHPWVA